MKIKFILLIALFSITMQSMANNKAENSVEVDKSYSTELKNDQTRSENELKNFKPIAYSSEEITLTSWISRNWLNIILGLSNLSLLLYALYLRSNNNKLNRETKSKNVNGYGDSSSNKISEMKIKVDQLERIKSKLEGQNKGLENELEGKNNENIELGKQIDDLKFQLNSSSSSTSELNIPNKANTNSSSSSTSELNIPNKADTNSSSTSELNTPNKADTNSRFIITKCFTENGQFYLIEAKQKNHTTPYLLFEKDNELYFKFDETNTLARSNAFNFYNIYMEGYCDGVNIRTDAHALFEVVNNSAGKLKKEGDKYLVVERIKVNYLG